MPIRLSSIELLTSLHQCLTTLTPISRQYFTNVSPIFHHSEKHEMQVHLVSYGNFSIIADGCRNYCPCTGGKVDLLIVLNCGQFIPAFLGDQTMNDGYLFHFWKNCILDNWWIVGQSFADMAWCAAHCSQVKKVHQIKNYMYYVGRKHIIFKATTIICKMYTIISLDSDWQFWKEIQGKSFPLWSCWSGPIPTQLCNKTRHFRAQINRK